MSGYFVTKYSSQKFEEGSPGTDLVKAACYGDLKAAEEALQQGAVVSIYYQFPLLIAVAQQDIPMIKLLIKWGARHRDKSIIYAIARKKGNPDVLALLT